MGLGEGLDLGVNAVQSKAYRCLNYLGKSVSEEWGRLGRGAECFPVLATAALGASEEFVSLPYQDLASMGAVDSLPAQADIEAKFGQPPITVFVGTGFRIELLFWLEGLPGIHQHAFSGAFHVLEGESLQSTWTFSPRSTIADTIVMGQMTMLNAELLRKGDVRRIDAGGSFIHSTFHLLRPTVSLVLRTIREDAQLPQYSYWPPTIAYDPAKRSGQSIRRAQLLQMLTRCGDDATVITILSKLSEDPNNTADIIFCLVELYSLWRRADVRTALVLSLFKDHGEVAADSLLHALDEQEKRLEIMRIRRKINDPELQLFLALLLNVPDAERLFDILKGRYGDCDPVSKIRIWLSHLEESNLLRGSAVNWVGRYVPYLKI